uniref:Uncharacterized protein n=1 Tax=Anopheles atroparvus TaxID=41427 RepID=A0A182J742_ANOAO
MAQRAEEVNDSLDRFRAMMAWQNRILALFGLYQYVGAHRMSWRIALLSFCPMSFIPWSLYCAVKSWGNMSEVVFSIVIIFFAFVAVARLAVGIGNPDGCYRAIHLAEQTYLCADRSRPAEKRVLAKYTRLLSHSVTVYTCSFFGGYMVIALSPFVFYLVLGQQFLPLGVTIPFVDPGTTSGYWATLAVQLAYMTPGPIGLTPSQNIYFAFIFNICMQYELLIVRLDDLNVTIRSASQSESERDRSEVRRKLVEIIQLQQRCANYIAHIEDCYCVQMFVEFLSNSLLMALTLAELSRSFWIPGYFILPVAFLQMLILCLLGTLIEVRSDQFIAKLYDIAWSEMSCKEQAMFKFVLTRAQQPPQLTCGGFAVINMNLFLSALLTSDKDPKWLPSPTQTDAYNRSSHSVALS